MPRYKLVLSYDGTRYSGWQIQPNAPSIQGKLQAVLEGILQESAYPVGAGRTDAGVHAHAQVAHFNCEKEPDLRRLFLALNGLLPDDIRAVSVEKVPDEFHSRYSANLKEYHYHICTRPYVSPFLRPYRIHMRTPMDLTLLRDAASQFLGIHDFTTFGNVTRPGTKKRNPIRSIDRLDVIETEDGLRLEFEGPGFLYKMVRNITGCLIRTATGKDDLADIPELFEAKDRRALGMAAPARGLFLVRVGYTDS